MKKYKHLVFAGTFDRLHNGHQKMLDRAFQLAEKVSLGITTEKMYKDKLLASQIESYEKRAREVKKYVSKYKNRVVFFKLSDPLGTSVTDQTMDSILVSEDTKKGAIFINTIRQKRGMNPLAIEVVPFLLAQDSKLMTSERIRKGEIDQLGEVYMDIFKKNLKLPDTLRDHLRIPLGEIIQGTEDELEKTARKTLALINKAKPTMVISVGDVVSASLIREEYLSDVQVIDLKTRRQIIKSNSTQKKIVNKPGTINAKAVSSLHEAIQSYIKNNKKKVIVIDGEEDLLALPAILMAPLGSIVLYGQFNLGIILVQVTDMQKQAMRKIVKQFVTN